MSVRTAKKTVESVGAGSGDTVGATSDRRDFAGQVLKTIGTTTYILIGNEDQLRAIGSNKEVYSAIYQTEYVLFQGHRLDLDVNGNPKTLYSGDADLKKEQNGRKNFNTKLR